MRKTGSEFEYKKERDHAVVEAFRRLASQCAHIRMPQLMQRVVKQPCARFWVSEERATIVVSAMLRGEEVTVGMGSGKRRMFAEICRRVSALRVADATSPLVRLVRVVVNAPAPEFYLSPRSAQNILSSMKGVRTNG